MYSLHLHLQVKFDGEERTGGMKLIIKEIEKYKEASGCSFA